MFMRTTQLILLSHIILGYASPSPQIIAGHVGKEPEGHEFCPAKKTDSMFWSDIHAAVNANIFTQAERHVQV